MKVSVMLLVYNHEQYVAQAIESVLMQQTDFDYEIVIGEDCSKDNSREIVIDYQKRHPDRIRLLLHEKNVGAHLNFEKTMKACSGEYIAILEGDDYWTSEHKLKEQADVLDNNPECSFSFHNALVVYENGSVKDYNFFKPGMQKNIGIEFFFSRNVPTASVMFRKKLLEFPEWYKEIFTLDWLINILNASRGKGYYIDEVMSVYRILPTGMSRDRIKINASAVKMFENLNVLFDYKYDNTFRERIKHYRSILASEYCKKGFEELKSSEYEKALLNFDKALEIGLETPDVHYGRALAYSTLGRFGDSVSEGHLFCSSLSAENLKQRLGLKELELEVRQAIDLSEQIRSSLPYRFIKMFAGPLRKLGLIK